MSDNLPDPIQPDQPAVPVSAGAGVVSAEAGALARRRKLVRMALSGAPLMLSLPTAVSAATLSSAFRAAQNDSSATPTKEVTSSDGWLRVPAVKLTRNGNGNPQPALYKIGNRYYLVSNGTEVVNPNLQPYNISANVFLLVLFNSDYAAAVPTVSEGVPFPIRSVGQGLHRSAWASVNPTGAVAYDGVLWVS